MSDLPNNVPVEAGAPLNVVAWLFSEDSTFEIERRLASMERARLKVWLGPGGLPLADVIPAGADPATFTSASGPINDSHICPTC